MLLVTHRIVHGRVQEAVQGIRIHLALTEEEDARFQMSVGTCQVQCGSIVIVRHPCPDPCFDHLSDLPKVILRSGFAECHTELNFAHLRTLCFQQPLHCHVLVTDSVVQWSLAKTIQGAQVQAAKLQHLRDRLQVAIGSSQMECCARIIISEIRVDADNIHEQFELGGFAIRRCFAQLDRSRHAAFEFSRCLNEELCNLRVPLSNSIV
mmetsp:Transcript_103602/g.246640  ORF Transcript_103602/g.246640 Transcript_103602/m.246640 type:complete len:208 (-) Transcript_103602:8192-8815(-)